MVVEVYLASYPAVWGKTIYIWTPLAWPLANQESCSKPQWIPGWLEHSSSLCCGNPASLGETVHTALPKVYWGTKVWLCFPANVDFLAPESSIMTTCSLFILSWLQNLLLEHLNMFFPFYTIWEPHTPWHPSPLVSSYIQWVCKTCTTFIHWTTFPFILYPKFWWSLQQSSSPSHTKMYVWYHNCSVPPVMRESHCHSHIHSGRK